MAGRRWYRLHWASWLALLLVGGTVICRQFNDRWGVGIGDSWNMSIASAFGWPLISIEQLRLETFDQAGATVSTTNFRTYRPPELLANAIACMAIVSCTLLVLERRLRHGHLLQFRLRTVFSVATVAAILLALLAAEPRLSLQAAFATSLMGYCGGWLGWQPWPAKAILLVGLGCTIHTAGWLTISLAARSASAVRSLITPASKD